MAFQFKILQPDDAYCDRWVTFRRGGQAALLAFCVLPVTFLVGVAILLRTDRPLPAILPVALHFLLAQFLGWRASQFPCPRCGRRFRNWSYYLQSSDNCQHCGLPEYSPNDMRG